MVADASDRDSLLRAVDGLCADAVIHELTALRKPPLRHSGMAITDRLRTQGTTNLLAAAEVLGAQRFVTQSFICGYGYYDHGDRILTEQQQFGRPAGNNSDPHVAAMRSAEQQAFTAPEGIALGYGLLYGGNANEMRALLARRALPVARGGLLGWVHLDDAAAATVAALEHGHAGEAYNIVDDKPACWEEVITSPAAGLAVAARRAVRRLVRGGHFYAKRTGLWGHSTAAGVAIVAGAIDRRIGCVACQNPSMLDAWTALEKTRGRAGMSTVRARLQQDFEQRRQSGEGASVPPPDSPVRAIPGPRGSAVTWPATGIPECVVRPAPTSLSPRAPAIGSS